MGLLRAGRACRAAFRGCASAPWKRSAKCCRALRRGGSRRWTGPRCRARAASSLRFGPSTSSCFARSASTAARRATCACTRARRAPWGPRRTRAGAAHGQGSRLTRLRRVRSGNAVSCGMSLFHGIATAVLSGREARRLARGITRAGLRRAHLPFPPMCAPRCFGTPSPRWTARTRRNRTSSCSSAWRVVPPGCGVRMGPAIACLAHTSPRPVSPPQGYFVLDSLHVIAYRLDPLFLLHHAQTLTYMVRVNAPWSPRDPNLAPGRARPLPLHARFGAACSAAAPCPSCGS